MKVLVTGAIGFVGINVVRCLAEQGDEVIALYRSAPDRDALDFLRPVMQRVQLVEGDVEDDWALAALVATHRPEGIVHAAAVTPKLETERNLPMRIMNINFMGTMRALEAAREHDVHRFLFVSSDGLYGGIQDPSQPVTEDTPARGEGLYPIAKVASEAVCKRYRALYGLEAVSGRVCATYGPMERPTRSRQGMSAICDLVRAHLEGRPARVRGLEIARTWTHVYDIAGELVALLKAPRHSWDAYNISYGKAYTLAEVLETLQKIEPSFSYQVVGPDEPADVAYGPQQQRGSLTITRVIEDSGFVPRFDLESGLRDYLAWVGAN